MINLAFDCRHNLKPNCTWNSLSKLTVSYVVSLYKDFLCCFALLWFKEQFGSLQKRLAATFIMCLSKASKMVTRYVLRLQQKLLLKINKLAIAYCSAICHQYSSSFLIPQLTAKFLTGVTKPFFRHWLSFGLYLFCYTLPIYYLDNLISHFISHLLKWQEGGKKGLAKRC